MNPINNPNRVLGRGSTATVYLSSDHLFAIKSSPIRCSQFLQREQCIHSTISSPHIIQYLGHEITDDSYNLFLEYAPGGSLSDDLRRRKKLTEPDIRSYTKDILLGLAHLHSNSIAHCDVKPQNVLIMNDGRAKIADLGCAACTEEENKKVQFMGTPMFMAPEVARGERQGTEADVWALGCTVIEMATGRPAWPDANDAAALLHRVGFSDDSPTVPDWLSEEGKDFLGKCLRREVGERWRVTQLLEHSFLSNCSDFDSVREISPKSTLEQDFWNSYSESEDNDDEQVLNRLIGDLCGEDNGPNWTWNDSWVTVRNEEEEEEEEEEETVGDAAENSSSSCISDDLSIFYESLLCWDGPCCFLQQEIVCNVLDDSLWLQLSISFCPFVICLCCLQ